MVMSVQDRESVVVDELNSDHANEIFNEHCQAELGITMDAFLDAYDSGSFPKEWTDEAVSRLEMLLPLVR